MAYRMAQIPLNFRQFAGHFIVMSKLILERFQARKVSYYSVSKLY